MAMQRRQWRYADMRSPAISSCDLRTIVLFNVFKVRPIYHGKVHARPGIAREKKYNGRLLPAMFYINLE